MKSMVSVNAGSLTRQQVCCRFASSLNHLLGAGRLGKAAVAANVPTCWSSRVQSVQNENDAEPWKCSFFRNPDYCYMLEAWMKEHSPLNSNRDYETLECQTGGSSRAPRAPSEYDLSLGKIVDVLKCDYQAMFERPPNFDIYDEEIVFELGRPFHAVSALRGKRRYCRALSAVRQLSCSAVRDGRVWCKVADGQPYGHALRVHWTCEGSLKWSGGSIYIDAISLYSVRAQRPPVESLPTALQPLSHRIHRHCIEFVEIHPPSLRSVLLRYWWQRHCNVDPVFAIGSGGVAAASTMAKGVSEWGYRRW